MTVIVTGTKVAIVSIVVNSGIATVCTVVTTVIPEVLTDAAAAGDSGRNSSSQKFVMAWHGKDECASDSHSQYI